MFDFPRSRIRVRGGNLGALVASAVLAAALTGCRTSEPTNPNEIAVAVGFYPLQYLVEELGGDRVRVVNLTRPGAEPHDLELTAREVITIAKSRTVFYLKGFQPAVDEAVIASQVARNLDVTAAAGLTPLTGEANTSTPALAAPEADHDHAGHDHAQGQDPHFWLDPHAFADVANAIAAELTEIDPAGSTRYEANRTRLVQTLDDLADDLRAGLAHCRSTDLVTSHAAFGHLAHLVGFEQHALALSPEAEPSPAQLAAITDFVRERGTTTIYTEPLVSAKVAETVAAESGAQLAVLDPIEGLTTTSAAPDYLGLMRANLATLKGGQQCQ